MTMVRTAPDENGNPYFVGGPGRRGFGADFGIGSAARSRLVAGRRSGPEKAMMQTKLESLFEQTLSTATGFALAFTAWRFVVTPLLGIPIDNGQNLLITSFFTVLSIARGYVWRRFFNAGIHKAVHNFLRR
jgi:hypothetical protein